MLIQERIQLIIKVNNETPSSFADKIGVKRSNLSHVLSGRNNPSLDFLAKIITSYPKVNASWLITGVTREGGFEETNERAVNTDSIDNLLDTNERIEEIDKIVIFYKNGQFKAYHTNE